MTYISAENRRATPHLCHYSSVLMHVRELMREGMWFGMSPDEPIVGLPTTDAEWGRVHAQLPKLSKRYYLFPRLIRPSVRGQGGAYGSGGVSVGPVATGGRAGAGGSSSSSSSAPRTTGAADATAHRAHGDGAGLNEFMNYQLQQRLQGGRQGVTDWRAQPGDGQWRYSGGATVRNQGPRDMNGFLVSQLVMARCPPRRQTTHSSK